MVMRKGAVTIMMEEAAATVAIIAEFIVPARVVNPGKTGYTHS